MHKIEANIEEHWNHLKLKNIVVACSGGLDSMVLVHLLKKLDFNVKVIHVNYQLRGEDSEQDAKFVESQCKNLDLPFRQKTIDLNTELENGGNLQEKAREFRYTWFRELIDNNEDYYVALAHHADDQIETFFMNLARKSGVTGLASIPKENNGIIRPLLNFTKETLKAYAEANSIEWREDASNADSKYRRNLLRNEILPELKKMLPNLDDSVLTLVRNFQDKKGELEEEVMPLYKEIIEHQKLNIVDFNSLSDFALIELFSMLDQPSGIALELRKLKMKGTKVKLVPSENHPFNSIVFDGDQLSFISDVETPLPKLIIETVDALPKSFSKNEIYLDKNQITGNLSLRRWKKGDRISPLGMKGSRLISDIVSDAKLNAFQKQNVFILCDSSQIHWCVGLCVGRLALNTSASSWIKCSIK